MLCGRESPVRDAVFVRACYLFWYNNRTVRCAMSNTLLVFLLRLLHSTLVRVLFYERNPAKLDSSARLVIWEL